MKVNIYGDLCPTGSNIEAFRTGNCQQIFGEIIALNKACDFSVVNLECAVADQICSIDKVGPQLVAPLSSIQTIANAGFSVVSLANNHAMDNGLESLNAAIQSVSACGMDFVGVKTDRCEKTVHVTEKEGVSVAVIAVGDHEYNTDDRGYGVVIFNEKQTCEQIAKLRETHHAVIVLYHSGMENFAYPSPGLICRCRSMVHAGASVVLCQHSHCIGSYEEYEGSLILYGQGNFLMDKTTRKTWHEGLLVSLDIQHSGVSYSFIPLVVDNGAVKPADSETTTAVLRNLQERSDVLNDPEELEKIWSGFVWEEAWKYQAMLMGGGRFHYIVCRLLFWMKSGLQMSLGKKKTLKLLLRSETHREAVQKLLCDKSRE